MESRNRVSHIGKLDVVAMKGLALFVGLLALVIATGCGGSTNPTNNNGNGGGAGGPVAATVSGTIPVGTAPDAIAVDSNNKVFVADLGSFPPNVYPQGGCYGSRGDVTAIDGTTESTTSIGVGPGGLFPNVRAVAVDSATDTAYVVTREGFAQHSQLSCGEIENCRKIERAA